MKKTLLTLATQVGRDLKACGWTMTTAESCTGGWIAKRMTDVAGSSQWFDRGFITYSNEAKQDMLGVKTQTLMDHGAVSGEVVHEMATGALSNSRADVAVAVSGIAGPDGGTKEKPVGTVWIAWATRLGEVRAECFCFDGDRDAVRRQAVITSLEGVLAMAGSAKPSRQVERA